jgi:DNA-binding Xre family transcriptional regulator
VYNEPVIILMLDEVLKEKGKTAYQVAKNTGLHQSVVSKIRRNDAKMIALDVLDRLCDELDCKPSDLIVHQSSKLHNTSQTLKPQSVKVDPEKPASQPKTPQTMASVEGMLSTVEVAKRLGLSRKSVNDYINKKLLPATKGKQNHNFVSEADLEKFIENR